MDRLRRVDRSDPAYKGQSGYNPVMLALYDICVLKFMARAVLKVPIPRDLDRYRANLGQRHLDVGPGTGYFIGTVTCCVTPASASRRCIPRWSRPMSRSRFPSMARSTRQR